MKRYASGAGNGPQLKVADEVVRNFAPISDDVVPVTHILGIPQGDGTTARDGNRVRYKSIEAWWYLNCVPPFSGNYLSSLCRLIIGYDKQPNGTTPTWTDVVGNINVGAETVQDPPNFFNKERFLILKDYRVQTPGFTASVTAGLPTFTSIGPVINSMNPPQHLYKKLKFVLDSKFNGSGATQANYVQGSFFVVTQSDQFSEGLAPWIFSFTARAIYSDSITN